MGTKSRSQLKRIASLTGAKSTKSVTVPSERSVFVGYCHPGVVDGAFHDSIVRMVQTNPLIATVCSAEAGPWLPGVRNMLAEAFMETDLEWYLQLDADMVFETNLPDRLIAAYEGDVES